jgi:hypothetical protein
MPKIPLDDLPPPTVGYEVTELEDGNGLGIPSVLLARVSEIEYYPDGRMRAVRFFDPKKRKGKEEGDGEG